MKMMKLTKSEEEKLPVKPSKSKLLASFTLGLISFSFFLYISIVDVTAPYLKYVTRIDRDTAVHEFLKKETNTVHLSVYLFNVTNAKEFMSGEQEKLAVEEVGPFSYNEIRTNENIEFDFKAGSLRYSPRVRLEFDPDRSVARPEDVNITMPNIPLLGLTSNVYNYGLIVRSTFDVLSRQLNSKAIVSMNAQKYMWGYNEPLVTLANTFIPGYVPMEKMGLLDRLYAMDKRNDIEVSLLDEDKFRIKSRNGFKKIDMVESSNPDDCALCSTLENTYEGMAYPSGLKPGFPLRLFRNGLCKVVDMKYDGLKRMDYGADAFVYRIDENFYKVHEDDNSTGLLLLPECFLGMPLAFSKAHFLDVDPEFYKRIDGMHPDESKHGGWITVDPKIGMELETIISLQINLVLGDTSYSPRSKSFSNMVIPICYMQLVQPELTEENASSLIRLYVIWPKVLLAMQLTSFVLTFIFWTYFLILFRRFLIRSEEVVNTMNFPSTLTTKTPIKLEEPLLNGTSKITGTKINGLMSNGTFKAPGSTTGDAAVLNILDEATERNSSNIFDSETKPES